MTSPRTEDQPELAICARELRKTYTRGGETVDVLSDLSIDVARGEFLAIMGPSGSGKTTLLNLIGGLDQPTGGALCVAGADLVGLGRAQLTRWRAAHVGFVFQMHHLLPALSAERNVELPLLLTSLAQAERKRRVGLALDLVGLADRARHRPTELSGGQAQRVGIARAIIHDPELLLCDEPTGDLDRRSADEILDLLSALSTDQGKTVIMVTHDPLAAKRANRTVHLDKGRLLDEGYP